MGRGQRTRSAAASADDIRASLRGRAGAGEPGWTTQPRTPVERELTAMREQLGAAGVDFESLAAGVARSTMDVVWQAHVQCERIAGELTGAPAQSVAVASDQFALACHHENADEANRSFWCGRDWLVEALRQLDAFSAPAGPA